MNYHVDRTEQLTEAVKRGRFGSVASLRAAGTPTRQHNSETKTTKKAVSGTTAKKAAASAEKAGQAVKKTAKKTAKKTTTKKS